MSSITLSNNRRHIVCSRDGSECWEVLYTNPDGTRYGQRLSDIIPRSHQHFRGALMRAGHQRSHSSHLPQAGMPGGQGYFPHHAPPAAYGPWQGNDYARRLFQGEGAARFIQADTFVADLTYIAAAAYTAAFFMPEIIGGFEYVAERTVSPLTRSTLNRVGAFGPAAGRLFWSGLGSGSAAAVRYGNQMGGSVGHVLEDSPLGSFLDTVQLYLPQNDFTAAVWKWLSTAYAEGAGLGQVEYFEGLDQMGNPYQGFMWLSVELPILTQRAIAVVMHYQPRP